MQGLYQVPVDLASDRFDYPNVTHTDFVADMTAAFSRLDEGGDEPEEQDTLLRRLLSWYARMPTVDSRCEPKTAPHPEALRNSVEHSVL